MEYHASGRMRIVACVAKERRMERLEMGAGTVSSGRLVCHDRLAGWTPLCGSHRLHSSMAPFKAPSGEADAHWHIPTAVAASSSMSRTGA